MKGNEATPEMKRGVETCDANLVTMMIRAAGVTVEEWPISGII